jgi:cysteine desulfurase
MIYLDYNSTTPVLPEVAVAMEPFLLEEFGNPSSAHTLGRNARKALEDARERIAELLGAFPDEVIFTSGATEANNLALFGLAGEPPGNIVASPIEHPCVIEPLRQLQARGFGVEWLRVGRDGIVQIPSPLGPLSHQAETGSMKHLITLMLVNHETGTIQPVPDLVSVLSTQSSALVHCDAAQAVGKMRIHFHELGVHALTASGHKFHAPKGAGLLLLRRGVKLHPLLWGGHQQQARRPGTESVALAVGLAMALQLCCQRIEETWPQLKRLRQRLLTRLRKQVSPVVVNGPEDERLQSPYVLNISFPGCRSDLLLMKLDLAGVACSTGSACSSGSLLPSPVLQAMELPDELLRSAMRFSFSPLLREADLDEAASRIIRCVKELRQDSADLF